MSAPLSEKRLAAIRAMKFVTGLNAACGRFDTQVERELYDLAAVNYNARLELLAEVERLSKRVADLEKDSTTLAALEAHGVDNWEGYSDALAGEDE